MNLKNDNKINCFSIVRGNDIKSVITALSDLYRHAHLTFVDYPRSCKPEFADDILVQVLNQPLKHSCQVAAIVPLFDDAGSAICRLRNIHPPAHVIILSPRHDIFDKVIEMFYSLPEMDFSLPDVSDRTEDK